MMTSGGSNSGASSPDSEQSLKPATQGYAKDAEVEDAPHAAVPWYRTRKCIIGGVLCGLFWLAVIIAGAVLLSSYLAGRPKGLPAHYLTCTGADCYTPEKVDKLNEPWNSVLAMHVAPGTINGVRLNAVDYAAIDKSPTGNLSRYLTALAELDLPRVPESEAIALLINAYNAFTVDLIARNHEGLKSITELSSKPLRTTWNTHTFDLGGASVTLDDIEHGNIRRRFDEPRIHAAVNCASVSCPDLRPEAYTGVKLEQQLEEQMKLWMGSSGKGLRLDRAANVLHLSKLFDWYGGDFVPPGVEAFACGYAPPGDGVCEYLSTNDVKTEFMPYDWSLNSQAPAVFTPGKVGSQRVSDQAAAELTALLRSDTGPGLPGTEYRCTENCYSAADFTVINRPWNAVLARHVAEGTIGGVAVAAVDYAGIDLSPEGDLARYTAALAEMDMSRVPGSEAIALLINAYNSFTVDLIARNLDGLGSIVELAPQPESATTWKAFTFRLGGVSVTLDDIEHGNIRQNFDEPRIHAAVNCASVSCPDLRPEAYTGAKLDQQLEEQMKLWMGSPGKGLRLDRAANVLHLSKLFDWYGGDFVPPGVEAFACGYAPPGDGVCEYLSTNDVKTEFMQYDWSLNSQERAVLTNVPVGDGGGSFSGGSGDSNGDTGSFTGGSG